MVQWAMHYDVSSVLSLISRIHSGSAEFLQKRLKAAGLPALASSHGFILFCLARNGRMAMGALADAINRDKSTTTALVKKLADAGLVKIERCGTDSRRKFIALTDAGKSYTAVTESLSRELLAAAWRGFSPAEQENALALLLRMSANISGADGGNDVH